MKWILFVAVFAGCTLLNPAPGPTPDPPSLPLTQAYCEEVGALMRASVSKLMPTQDACQFTTAHGQFVMPLMLLRTYKWR